LYILKTNYSFDSAHFLSGYDGKCKNIHGHRWTVEIEIHSNNLIQSTEKSGMLTDFVDFKKDLKNLLDYYDHCLIIEKGSLSAKTFSCLIEENFRIVQVDFRPTAENFSHFFYNELSKSGYNVKKSTVYETPSNSATYELSEEYK
jgi:6-pyruvoyltetrahydropterin/6-carboxytetrahydropterin synthase